MTTNLRLRLVTWNVKGCKPTEDLRELLALDEHFMPNVYAIGLQEVDASNLVADFINYDPWTRAITEILVKRGFLRLKQLRLIGILLLVFVHKDNLAYITNVESEYTRTGLYGLWGNKGGVSIRLDLYGVNVCFVNCHLAAHTEQLEQRVMEYNTIVQTQCFKDASCPSILDHDYIFWMGDMNFRLDGDISTEHAVDRIKRGDMRSLWPYDQLKKLMKEEMVFLDFKEAPLNFPPSYKFDVDTDNYNLSRMPSWCDRILWFVHEDSFIGADLAIDQASYNSHQRYKSSDHKPVSSDFLIKVLRYPRELPVMFEPCGVWCCYKDAVCTYLVTNSELQVSSYDWIALYKSDYEHLDDYVTYVWASTAGEDMGDGSSIHRVTFDKNYLQKLAPADYYLSYYSSKRKSFVGFSDLFKLSLIEESDSDSSSWDSDSSSN